MNPVIPFPKPESQGSNLFPSSPFHPLIGNSKAFRQVLAQIQKVAPTDATVLIRGETGTGKEMVATAIHQLSLRRENAFIKVNCSALTETLIGTELFGHEKGAFTGAQAQKIGRFELAHQGTLLLDEIGELSHEIQIKILRVLQEKEFERVGGVSPVHIDVRLIAATNRDLESALQAGQFRSDLFFRLNVFPIQLPPLRERTEDIEALTWYFIKKHSRKLGRTIEGISLKTLENLKNHSWPGNIRELENVIERNLIAHEGTIFQAEPLGGGNEKIVILSEKSSAFSSLNEAIRNHILEALKITKGKIYGKEGAAELLDLKPTTLMSKMKRLSILPKKEFE